MNYEIVGWIMIGFGLGVTVASIPWFCWCTTLIDNHRLSNNRWSQQLENCNEQWNAHAIMLETKLRQAREDKP